MGLKSNQTLVGYSNNFYTFIALAYVSGRIDCRSKFLWLGRSLHFSFGNLQSAFLYQGHWNIGVRALCRHQLNTSIFNELCSCCLQQWDLDVCLCKTTWQQTELFGDFHRTTLASNSIGCNPVPVLKLSFDDRR